MDRRTAKLIRQTAKILNIPNWRSLKRSYYKLSQEERFKSKQEMAKVINSQKEVKE